MYFETRAYLIILYMEMLFGEIHKHTFCFVMHARLV
jgi:hypothetical protein